MRLHLVFAQYAQNKTPYTLFSAIVTLVQWATLGGDLKVVRFRDHDNRIDRPVKSHCLVILATLCLV